MPSEVTYPGVYVEESPGDVHTIAGVATSVAAFVDYFRKGPVNKAVKILGMGDFERHFGGLDPESEASYAIHQFFLNGGTEAWVVRIDSDDDSLPKSSAIIGSFIDKSGIYALQDVDLFNILCIPLTAKISETGKSNSGGGLTPAESSTAITAAIDYCEKRHAFFIVDTPNNINDVEGIKRWLTYNAGLPKRNAALYFPRVKIPDPTDGLKLKSRGASGTIAGLYARTDSARGVWKAPAGLEASLVNVQALECEVTDDQNGVLDSLGINCLRSFPGYGNVCWGARTLDSADLNASSSSEWKYVPVRRLALFLEDSLYRGTKWVVFEPNGESLWAQIRLSVGAFMDSLFVRGAFQGERSAEAYFVKCDKDTTTQNDIDAGLLNIMVGFAPLKPAEFIVIKIQQRAGHTKT